MKFAAKSFTLGKQNKASFILAVTEQGRLTELGQSFNQSIKDQITQLLKKGDFQAKMGQTHFFTALPQAESILLVGCGTSTQINERDYGKLIQTSIKFLQHTGATQVVSGLAELNVTKRSHAWKVKYHVESCSEALYCFDQFKSKKSPTPKFKEIIIHIGDKKSLKVCEHALDQGRKIAEAVSFTKNLANLPSNICTPTYLAAQAKNLAKAYAKVTTKVLEEKDMKKLGMGAFLAVSQGSQQDAKLICVEYKGAAAKQAPIALVGKGITFDTGGLSLKPADAMVGMKYDMCGAATVLGTIKAAAELRLSINIVGICAASENMPSGCATKPEDIVTSMSGQTIEIMNTDAEGRLVLCDALTYCERFKPAAVIDIATLTGAVVVALGTHATGLLSNDEGLAKDLLHAGIESHDRAWELPLWEEYQDQLKSPFADMSNVGGRWGGTITAACFLSRFAKKFKWAHLDVAGTAAMMGGNDRYATGRPVPMLVQYLLSRCK